MNRPAIRGRWRTLPPPSPSARRPRIPGRLWRRRERRRRNWGRCPGLSWGSRFKLQSSTLSEWLRRSGSSAGCSTTKPRLSLVAFPFSSTEFLVFPRRNPIGPLTGLGSRVQGHRRGGKRGRSQPTAGLKAPFIRRARVVVEEVVEVCRCSPEKEFVRVVGQVEFPRFGRRLEAAAQRGHPGGESEPKQNQADPLPPHWTLRLHFILR